MDVREQALAELPRAEDYARAVSLDDPGLARVSRELDKLDSLSADGAVDWRLVAELSATLLAGRTKDLHLAVYLARALWEREGEDGLITALELLRGLLARFGERLQPREPDERSVALMTLDAWVEGGFPILDGWAPERLARANELLAGLLAEVEGLLGEAAPKMTGCEELARRLQGRLAEVCVPRTEPALAPAPAPAMASQPGGDVGPHSVDSLPSLLVGVAERVRAESPTSPLAIRLLRAGVWLTHETIELDERGRLHWGRPSASDRSFIAGLAVGPDRGELLEACERQLADTPLWLDLQRLAAGALQSLDGGAAGRAALVDDLRAQLRSHPGLRGLCYDDGQPVADAATGEWLDREIVGGPAAAADAPAPLDPLALQDAVARASGGRERLLMRREQARACVRLGRPEAAAYLYAALSAELERRRLATWEPELVRECLSEFVAVGRTMSQAVRRRLGVSGAEERLVALAPFVALVPMSDDE